MDIICELNFTPPPSVSRIVVYSPADVLSGPGKVLYVFDSNTRPLFSEHSGNPCIVLPPGEAEKNLASVECILKAAVDRHLTRGGVMAGVGGGVVCDMAAFAASVYMRGCHLILIPTTLLAMVDAAVGGKTGVDFEGYKNLAGSFYPAEEVRICLPLLKSLPADEYINGLAEVVKYALLGEGTIQGLLETRWKDILSMKPDVLEEIIVSSVRMKAEYIRKDPLERGIRAHLNFGHTFAHALEASGGFKDWSHGRAVAWGMVKALKLGNILGITPDAYLRYAGELIKKCGFETEIQISEERRKDLIKAMRHDKKNTSEGLSFVLQKDLGQTCVKIVDESTVYDVMD